MTGRNGDASLVDCRPKVPGSYAKAVSPTKRDKQVPFRVEVRVLRVCTVGRFDSYKFGERGMVPSCLWSYRPMG